MGGCWFGNYCIDSVNSWDSCPGVCSNMCNWTPKNGATWVSTPTDAGWATGARTSTWVAALTSTWSAREASWRSRRLWHTVLTLDLAPPTTVDSSMAPTMALTIVDSTMAQVLAVPTLDLGLPTIVGPISGPTMALTMAQALTKDYTQAPNYIKRLAKIKQKI